MKNPRTIKSIGNKLMGAGFVLLVPLKFLGDRPTLGFWLAWTAAGLLYLGFSLRLLGVSLLRKRELSDAAAYITTHLTSEHNGRTKPPLPEEES